MPDFVAFDWERDGLCGLEAQVVRGRVQIRRGFQLRWPDDVDPDGDPLQAGQWLAAELGRCGVRSRQALIALPREDVVVRQLQVPDVPDEELADVVYLQAETKTSSSLDRLALDYLPLPPVSAEGRHVLMATLPKERLEKLQQTAAAAELELVSVGIVPTAAAELVARAEQQRGENPEEACLVVIRYGRRVEILVMRSRHLLFTHSTQVTGQDEEEDSRLTLAEIRRSQGALMRLDPDIAVRRAWLLGREPETASLARALQDRLACDVRTIDPTADSAIEFHADSLTGEPAAYAGPSGLLLAQTGSIVESVDFLNPRRRVVRTDRRRLKIGAAAAGIVLAAGVAYGGVLWRAAELDDRIADERERINGMDKTIEEITDRHGPVVRHAQAVRDWERTTVDVLEQLQALKDAVQTTDRLYLDDLRFTSTPTARQIQGAGFARSRNDVERLYRVLTEVGYVVNPREISRTGDDEDYPYRFDLEIEVALPPDEADSSTKTQTGPVS